MPRRKVQDLDFEIHVDQSCISEPMDHEEPTEMETTKDLGVEQTPASNTETKLESEVKPEADLELNNETDDTQDTPIPKDLEDDTHKAEAEDADATPLADEDTNQDAHSESESEGSDSRRESTGSSGSYVSHRRTSKRTEALIQAAARDIVDQIELNRGRESMNSYSGTEDSFISRPQGSARPSDAHSVASHGRESLQSHAESLRSHAESRHDAESHHDDGRESLHSHVESLGHEESLNSRRESIHSHAESSGSHQRESLHAEGESYMSHHASPRQSDAHRSVAESHHSTEDERSSSRNDNDDDVFSDHSPRSSMGSVSESEHKKMAKIAQMDRSPRISDISQYDGEHQFVPQVRETPRPAFRSPSSVKAMQMSSPPASVLGSPRARRGLSTISRLGSPSVSAQYSPKKTPPRFKRNTPPLVLLHVTLLPLRWGWGDVLDRATTNELSQDGKTLRDAWRQLQDVMGDTTVERGILLPHPQNDYEILEERLLEALELPMRRRARILDCGHYLGPSNLMTMVDESDSEDEDYEDDRRISKQSMQTHWCKTCRTEIRYDSLGIGKIFRVKVYASNGLMKAGAWEACWKEMERVDVELEPLVDSKAQEELNRLEAEQERELELQEQYEDELDDAQEEYSDQEDLEDELGDALEHEERGRHFSEELRHEEPLERHEEVHDHHDHLSKHSDHPSEPSDAHDDHVSERSEVQDHLSDRSEIHDHITERSEIHDHLSEHSKAHEDLYEHHSEVHDRDVSFTEPAAETSEDPEMPECTPEFEEQLRREEERIREIYGHAPTHDDETQHKSHEHYAERHQPSAEPAPEYASQARHAPSDPYPSHESPKSHKNDSLPELLLESGRVLMQDKKNVMIGLLSILIVLLAMRGGQTQPDPRTFQTLVVSPTVTVTQVPAVTEMQLEAPTQRQVQHQYEEIKVAERGQMLEIAGSEVESQVDESQFQESQVQASQAQDSQVQEVQVRKSQIRESQAQEIQTDNSQVEKSEVEETQVEEIQIEETQVEETQAEESQAEEIQVKENEVEENEAEETQVETQVEGSQVEDNQAEETPTEGSQAEESQVEENQVEGSQVEENLIEESHVQDYQAEESKITEREIPDDSIPEEIFPQESVIPSESLSVAESISTPQDSHTTAPASSRSLDPCASCSLTRDDQSASQETDALVQEPLRETETVISERIIRIVETVTSVETVTETQLVSEVTQPSELFKVTQSNELEDTGASAPEESASVALPEEVVESVQEVVAEPSVKAEALVEEHEVEDESIEEPELEQDL
ncbi:hypothetical protein EDB81DRAFT_452740 [Dactylonectria macrodidyma]|uniref:Pathway-specific nitrogen regulator n=1 Tax=Dactylonectria macrodidyma TaxID=307937 RepID=A0A9P9JC25_9HYPO|nr:hypothetical protein EDB81DRAFT_452740 [Dactylonectria macrodidyma]